MQVAKNIYANTDKFIAGNITRFVYSGRLFNKETVNDSTVYFCYSQTKPKKDETENIHKIKMKTTDIGAQVDLLLEQLGIMYFYFETDDKRDNNRGHCYKIEVEEMPLALLILNQQSLPQKLSWFDSLKDQIKDFVSKTLHTFSKLNYVNSYTKESTKKEN